MGVIFGGERVKGAHALVAELAGPFQFPDHFR